MLHENDMDILRYQQQHFLVTGLKKLTASVGVCLLRAGHKVTLHSPTNANVMATVEQHLADMEKYTGETVDIKNLEVITTLGNTQRYDGAIVITNEDIEEKAAFIKELDKVLHESATLAINTESIALDVLQSYSDNPGRLLGVNWVEPAHTTSFLEIITNEISQTQLVDDFCQTARELWRKDPYVLKHNQGIRAQLMCALLREAFFLVENNYVTIEDIDRACRNDAGYYMSFAGNFRYMDLMGTYMYGIVMQELNPELSKDTHIPDFCKRLIDTGSKGMITGEGFYHYEPGEAQQWDTVFRKFSYQIQQIIEKYPFSYKQKSKVLR
ncbi:3-hydroxyacyl-CoA dehydrogenase NAD-binding domain-containing protein [Mucilaginibacter sp. CSA2-8R]|uniref:3-hydroxyacyl-CoA dehydrogenase NAD-binding domain-containing protein n=1 Tax=Mucilaginibacter sp. CSA2-8R TaxID=3141542 RepID=UPI00315C4F65